MTPFCQRRPDESIAAWHRRIHETAHDWRDVAELLVLRGLHAEAKMVTSVAHLKREERTVALLGVAEERDGDAERFLSMAKEAFRMSYADFPAGCGVACVWTSFGPCDCRAPAELHRLRQRARALRWAAEALMRPEPVREVFSPIVGSDPPEEFVLHLPARGPTVDTLKKAAEVCLRDAKDAPHDEKMHLKRLADQMTERAGGLARSAAEVRR